MAVLKLLNNDLSFDSDKLEMINNIDSDEEILQRIQMRFNFIRGEWFLNTNHGIPYLTEILNKKSIDNNSIESIFRNQLLLINGVKMVIESSIDFDKSTREMKYFFNVLSINNKNIISEITS